MMVCMYGKIAASAALSVHFDLHTISTGQSISISTFLYEKMKPVDKTCYQI